MRKKPRVIVVDFHEADHRVPREGDLVRVVSYRKVVKHYLRVLSVRQVKVRVSRGEAARYRCAVERLLGGRPPDEGVDWTTYEYPPKPKVSETGPGGRFNPLI